MWTDFQLRFDLVEVMLLSVINPCLLTKLLCVVLFFVAYTLLVPSHLFIALFLCNSRDWEFKHPGRSLGSYSLEDVSIFFRYFFLVWAFNFSAFSPLIRSSI